MVAGRGCGKCVRCLVSWVVSVGGACVDEERVGMAAKHPEQRREEVERRQMQRRLEGRRCGYLPGQGGVRKDRSRARPRAWNREAVKGELTASAALGCAEAAGWLRARLDHLP